MLMKNKRWNLNGNSNIVTPNMQKCGTNILKPNIDWESTLLAAQLKFFDWSISLNWRKLQWSK